MSHDAVRLGRMAVVANLVLAAGLTLFLLAVTGSAGDVVPRPVPLLVLYATPGVVGAIGVLGRRGSLLLASGAALLPGSLLSFAGVTLVFVLPAALYWAAGVATGRPAGRGTALTELLEATVAFGLMIAAAVALFATVAQGCFPTADGEVCGNGFLTWTGVALAVALDLAAVVFAAWRTGFSRGLGRRASS